MLINFFFEKNLFVSCFKSFFNQFSIGKINPCLEPDKISFGNIFSNDFLKVDLRFLWLPTLISEGIEKK